ncbi:MAG: hypothetical protein Q4E62_08200, partial [Sutterellaceae bacterium]|nr:hypothetical protein [Sutterellaceae bacterium]
APPLSEDKGFRTKGFSMKSLNNLWQPFPQTKPESYDPYLVTRNGELELVMWYGAWQRYSFSLNGVTAWMPLVNTVKSKKGWAKWVSVKDKKPKPQKQYLVLGKFSLEGPGSACMDLAWCESVSEEGEIRWQSKVWSITHFAEVPDPFVVKVDVAEYDVNNWNYYPESKPLYGVHMRVEVIDDNDPDKIGKRGCAVFTGDEWMYVCERVTHDMDLSSLKLGNFERTGLRLRYRPWNG